MKRTAHAVALGLLVLACGDSPRQQKMMTPRTDADTLRMKYEVVYDLVRDLTCSETSDCATTPLGVKPCGGPWMHLVYSKPTVDADALSRAVADLDAYEAQFNAEHGRLSDCALAPVLTARCVDNKCVGEPRP